MPITLVTGATGAQGGALARRLLKENMPVRAMTRNPLNRKAKLLTQVGAQVVKGDMDKVESLKRACEGIETVFSVQNFWERGVGYQREVDQGCALAKAASDAGVKHFIQTSVAGCDHAPGVEHFKSKYVIEQYIDSLKLPRTFLREVFFMENFFEPIIVGLGKRRIDPHWTLRMLLGALRPDLSFHMVTVEDIAWFAADMVMKSEDYIGNTVDVASDSLTIGEISQVYEEVYQRSAPKLPIPFLLTKLQNAEMGRQLEWNNQIGWHFDLKPLRARHPGLTRFKSFLSAKRGGKP